MTLWGYSRIVGTVWASWRRSRRRSARQTFLCILSLSPFFAAFIWYFLCMKNDTVLPDDRQRLWCQIWKNCFWSQFTFPDIDGQTKITVAVVYFITMTVTFLCVNELVKRYHRYHATCSLWYYSSVFVIWTDADWKVYFRSRTCSHYENHLSVFHRIQLLGTEWIFWN